MVWETEWAVPGGAPLRQPFGETVAEADGGGGGGGGPVGLPVPTWMF